MYLNCELVLCDSKTLHSGSTKPFYSLMLIFLDTYAIGVSYRYEKL